MNAPWEMRPPEWPSDLAIDACLTGEATPEQRAAVDACAARDPEFRALLETRAAGLDAMTDARMRQRLGAPRAANVGASATPRRRFAVGPGTVIGGLAAAAALFVSMRSGDAPQPSGDNVRARGAASFHVFRKRGEALDEVLSGDLFQAGDRLRFRARGVSPDAYVLVAGVERDGRLFAYAPAEGGAAQAGGLLDAEGTFPGAAELDASRGIEWAHLVHCAGPFELAQLRVEGDTLAVPEGCATSAFRVVKP
jgi:hypothetical protein